MLFAAGVLLLLIVNKYCAPGRVQTPDSSPGNARISAQPNTKAADVEERDIVDLMEQGRVAVATQGSGIRTVRLKVRRLVDRVIIAHIPVGTFFVSRRASAQNMVTTAERPVALNQNDWVEVDVPAACANRPKHIPAGDDSFAITRSPRQAELQKLMPVLQKAGVGPDAKQAGVWIVTDNADYAALGILRTRLPYELGPGLRAINESDAAGAMKACDDAGIDITRKAIWRDRNRILNALRRDGLQDAEVYPWLQNRALQNRSKR